MSTITRAKVVLPEPEAPTTAITLIGADRVSDDRLSGASGIDDSDTRASSQIRIAAPTDVE